MSDEQTPNGNEPLPTSPPPGQSPPPVPPPAPPPAPGVSQPTWGAPPPVPPSAWAQPAPPALPPPTPPRRDRAALAVVLFVFGGLFVVFLAFLLLAYGAVKGESPRLSGGPRIGVIEVKGEIGTGGLRNSVDAESTLKVVKRFMDDADMKAVVVRIDSPGGAVAPSQEIYDELRKLADKKIVVCSMGNLAASGGFYIAMACPLIMAEPGTLTGSIGVVSQFPNVKGLADKLAVKVETLKSGKLKDAGNPFREMTPDDRAYWQTLIDQVYGQFVAAVAESRELSVDDVKKIADGRVITGQQAQELGLIDEIGNFNDAVDTAKERAGLTGEPRLVYGREDKARVLEELLGGAVHSVADAVRAEVRQEASAIGSPGLFYLAR
jgi:protease IV